MATKRQIDGTSSNLLGKSIDFAGPNYGGGPWTLSIDMGGARKFTHWRVAGNRWYSFGDASLRYVDSWSQLVSINGSDVVFDREGGGFAMGTFAAPVTASEWQVYISTHTNPNFQSRYQLYLTEVQFGVASPNEYH